MLKLMSLRRKSLDERFDLYALPSESPDGCWSWLGPFMDHGYAAIGHKYKTLKASRVSWARFNGPIPKGLEVCHRCDNPACVNPDHLFLGTHAENMADMRNKGRGVNPPRPVLGQNPNAKVTETDIRDIRYLLGLGMTQKAVGTRYGMVQTAISLIKTGKVWNHVV